MFSKKLRQSGEVKLLSVVVPAYRQEKTIKKDLERLVEVLGQLRYPFEIVCVVDGETDGTGKEARKVRNSRVRVVGYKDNRGKGWAVRYGMERTKGDVVAFIDAGMDINPNGLAMCLEHFLWYGADVVVGSKRHPASKVAYPWQREVLSWGYQFLVWLLFGFSVRDTQVGLKVFRREVLEAVLPRLVVKQWAFDIEMLAVARHLGFGRIYEAPVELKLDFGGGSALTSGKWWRTLWLMLWETLAVFYRLYFLQYYEDDNRENWVKF